MSSVKFYIDTEEDLGKKSILYIQMHDPLHCAKRTMHKWSLVNFVQNDKKITIKIIEIHFYKEYNVMET